MVEEFPVHRMHWKITAQPSFFVYHLKFEQSISCKIHSFAF